METPAPSPTYNVHGPRPWTSFKDTPPSPLLVLRKTGGTKYRAPPAPIHLPEGGEGAPRRSSKKRAPAPPVRSTSLKDEEEEDNKQVNVSKIEASPKVTIDLGDAVDSSKSYKNEVSIFVFPENEKNTVERKLDGEDSHDGEIILDVSQLQDSLDDALENFGKGVVDIRDENSNVKVIEDMDKEEKKQAYDRNHEMEITNQSSFITGRKLAITGWEKFVEGILSWSKSLSVDDELSLKF